MKKIVNLCILLAVLLLPLTVTTAVQAKPLATVPANFWVDLWFTYTGADRVGVALTGISNLGPLYRAGVACSLQTNAGTVIDTGSLYGTYGGNGVAVGCFNLIGDTGRIVLFSTHSMWVGATYYSESKMLSSSG